MVWGQELARIWSVTLTDKCGCGLLIAICFFILSLYFPWAETTYRHETWHHNWRWCANASQKTWSKSLRWWRYKKGENFERPAPDTMSPIDFKFDTHLQLNVLYKKPVDKKGHHDGFFANLHNLKTSNVTFTFCISTVSTPKLVYSLGWLRYTFLSQRSKTGGKIWPPLITKPWKGWDLAGNWP